MYKHTCVNTYKTSLSLHMQAHRRMQAISYQMVMAFFLPDYYEFCECGCVGDKMPLWYHCELFLHLNTACDSSEMLLPSSFILLCITTTLPSIQVKSLSPWDLLFSLFSLLPLFKKYHRHSQCLHFEMLTTTCHCCRPSTPQTCFT